MLLAPPWLRDLHHSSGLTRERLLWQHGGILISQVSKHLKFTLLALRKVDLSQSSISATA